MKLLLDFIPIAAFFVAYKLADIYVATKVIIILSISSIGITRKLTGKFDMSQCITALAVTIFGGATLIFKSEIYIKWKPTIAYWVIASIFIASNFIGKVTAFEKLAGKSVSLASNIWSRLNWSWGIFMLAMGWLNLFVVYNFSTDTWAIFKLFGGLGLTIIFIVIQSIYIFKHAKQD